jgi:hypothetical protein
MHWIGLCWLLQHCIVLYCSVSFLYQCNCFGWIYFTWEYSIEFLLLCFYLSIGSVPFLLQYPFPSSSAWYPQSIYLPTIDTLLNPLPIPMIEFHFHVISRKRSIVVVFIFGLLLLPLQNWWISLITSLVQFWKYTFGYSRSLCYKWKMTKINYHLFSQQVLLHLVQQFDESPSFDWFLVWGWVITLKCPLWHNDIVLSDLCPEVQNCEFEHHYIDGYWLGLFNDNLHVWTPLGFKRRYLHPLTHA